MLNTLDYQIMQSKLQQASFGGVLYNKQQALNYYINQMGNSVVQHEATFKIVAKNHGYTPSEYKINVYELNEIETDLHIEAAHYVLNSEITKRINELEKYQRAEKLLFESEQEFSKTQVLHKNKENNLHVEDLLKVSKYSIAFAEIMNPDDENIELASAAITVFQGIEAVLNNKPLDIPMNKKLHIANGFLSSIVKANIENKDTKRGITITSTLIDLVIDFFTGE